MSLQRMKGRQRNQQRSGHEVSRQRLSRAGKLLSVTHTLLTRLRFMMSNLSRDWFHLDENFAHLGKAMSDKFSAVHRLTKPSTSCTPLVDPTGKQSCSAAYTRCCCLQPQPPTDVTAVYTTFMSSVAGLCHLAIYPGHRSQGPSATACISLWRQQPRCLLPARHRGYTYMSTRNSMTWCRCATISLA